LVQCLFRATRYGVKDDLRRRVKRSGQKIDSEGSIFSIRKKTDGRERSKTHMLVDKDGDLRLMLIDKDGVL
jgi:hypothetical protein